MAGIRSRPLRWLGSFAANIADASSDITAWLYVAADGRYRIDFPGMPGKEGPKRVICDGEHIWRFAGDRVFRWSAEPLPEGIVALLEPSLLLGKHSARRGGVEVRRGGGAQVIPVPESPWLVTAPLSGTGILADKAEIVTDERLGVALRIGWSFRGETSLEMELVNIADTVDPAVFQPDFPPDMRIITTKNPLVGISAKDAAASARMIVSDVGSWISKSRGGGR
jgi:hypothetical protein